MKFYFVVICMVLKNLVLGQFFYGSVVAGVNLAQIEGDNSAGYNKYMPTGGFRVDYPISPSTDIATELLYSGRGAKGRVNGLSITLHYMELPILMSYRDWYIEDKKYDKVRAEGGMSLGYLFQSAYNTNPISQLTSTAKNFDMSFVAGIGYMFNKNVGLSARYTRSLLQMVKDDRLVTGGFRSYFVTVRGEYHF